MSWEHLTHHPTPAFHVLHHRTTNGNWPLIVDSIQSGPNIQQKSKWSWTNVLPCLTHIACDFVWMDKCSLSDISALIAGFHHLIKSCYLLELACESYNYMYIQNW